MSAEGAEYKSIPNIPLIEFNFVTLEERSILFLESGMAMMLLLTSDIPLKSRDIRLAY